MPEESCRRSALSIALVERLLRVLVAVPFLVLIGTPAQSLYGEVTEEQRAHLRRAFDAVAEAGKAYQGQKFEDSAEHLVTALEALGQGLEGADQETYERSASIIDRIQRAHALLQLEGIVLPPMERPVWGRPWKTYADAETKITRYEATRSSIGGPKPRDFADLAKPSAPAAAAATRPKRTARSRNRTRPEKPEAENAAPSDAPTGISFVRQVAPLLVAQCGGCHIERNQGGLSLASYAAILKGPAAGVILFPGDAVGSRLIEVIETGDMPRGGGSVSPANLKMLKDWVTEGAKFDGSDPNVPLRALAAEQGGDRGERAPQSTDPPKMAAGDDPPAAMPEVPDEERISFSRQVAPLLIDHCSGCHINANQLRGGLNMTTLAQLLRGGDSGTVVDRGDGKMSLLVRKLRGEVGQRMPAGGRPPLPEESIALISSWIDQGARLDAGVDTQPLPALVTEAWVKTATAEELSQRRGELAQKNWRLGAPESARLQPLEFSSGPFVVVGNIRSEEAERIASAATIALERLRTALPGGRDADPAAAAMKGNVTIFALARRYDYSEFAKMVEQREIPASWSNHWRYDGLDAYIAMSVEQGEDVKQLSARLLAPLASLLIAQRGPSPHWFREGMGRAIAARAGGRDFELDNVWEMLLPQALKVVKEPKELIEGKLPPEETDLIGYAVAKTLLDRRYLKSLDGLLQGIAEGEKFEDAFASSFRVPLERFVAAWFGVPGS